MVHKNHKWEADAGNIVDFNNFNTFVYRNNSVSLFLDEKGKMFVIAAKGMGKTLLLSNKRFLLENEYLHGDGAISVTMIPSQQPYISFVESIKTTLSQEHINCLRNWEYCKKIWVLVIELCVIFRCDGKCFMDNLPSQAQRHKGFLAELLQGSNSIEYIFNSIISLSESTLTKLNNDISNYVGMRFCQINQGVMVFFDRLDNALETAHDEIWTPIQAGLLEAAWDVMRSNAHVKIFLSIRQEAYAAHRSRNKNAISSSVLKVEYSRDELKELVDHLVRYYEGFESLTDFLGFDTFPNTVTFKDENVFDFMYRYSIGRPRDFVQFCGELSAQKGSFHDIETRRRALKERVRKISSDTIIDSLFDELRMLMKCLTTADEFKRFLGLLTHNILNYDELRYCCQTYNGNSCTGNCALCPQDHQPFCDLYNMGLLGIVEEPVPGFDRMQRFKAPYEDLVDGLRAGIDFFLIHPALREYISDLHRASSAETKYELYTGILVGAELPWTNRETHLYQMNSFIRQVKNQEIYSTLLTLLEEGQKSLGKPLAETQFDQLQAKKLSIIETRIAESLKQYLCKEIFEAPKPISVFVSYAYDSLDHQERVMSFVNMLRSMGFDAKMDKMLKMDYPDIDQMMTYGLQCDKVIVVLSPEYKQKADCAIGGVWKEFKMIADDLEIHPQKYIFVSFDSYSDELKKSISPNRIGNRWVVDLVKGKKDNYNELVAFITEEREYPFLSVNKQIASVKQMPIKLF